MKRIVAIGLVVLVAFATGAWAGKPCTIGVKGGVNIASVGGADADSIGSDSRTGFTGGAFMQVDLSKSAAVRLEALYIQKGAKSSASGIDATAKLDYVEFPILLVGQIPASESATFSAFAGPVLGFNTSAKVEATANILGYSVSGSVDIKDQIASFEFGLAFGLGASFDAGPVDIVVDGRYNLGLTTIDDSGNEDVKNQGFAFMAGVGFPVGSAQ